jgi:hypothetical protein
MDYTWTLTGTLYCTFRASVIYLTAYGTYTFILVSVDHEGLDIDPGSIAQSV